MIPLARDFSHPRDFFCVAAVVVATYYVDAIVIKQKNVIAFELSMLLFFSPFVTQSTLQYLSINFHRHQIVINLRRNVYDTFIVHSKRAGANFNRHSNIIMYVI